MRSIRSLLTTWLLGGLAALWIAAAAGIYFSLHHSLIKSLDAELALDSRIVRFAARGSDETTRKNSGARRRQERMPAYDEADGDAFFQVWDDEGNVLEKSPSLGDLNLAFPGGAAGKTPTFGTAQLADARGIRTMTFRSASGGKGKGKGKGRKNSGVSITVLAVETAPVRETLDSVIGGLSIVGLGLLCAAVLLVRLGIDRGLQPLARLARQTGNFDAQSLDARFEGDGAPAELQPVYTQLNNLIDRLETSFERERRFNADLAHELRTPVAELKMLNEVALKWEDQAGEKAHQESLEIADQLEQRIETLLMLVRCESGELSPEVESVDAEKLVNESWAAFSKHAGEKELQVAFDFPAETLNLDADPALLRHILDNLFSNAVDYTPEKGSILIAGTAGRLSIANDAPLLSESDVPHLFERYWRRDQSRTGTKHAGLGLSLAKACAEACGLEIEATFENQRLNIGISPTA